MKPIKRVACGVAALAAIAGATIALPATSASALPPGASPAGAATLSVAGGTSNTAFQIVPPAGAACPGTAASGYRYQTYIAPSTVDVGTLIWDFSGLPTGTQLVPPSGAPAFDLGGAQTAVPANTGNLRNSGGTALRGFSPAIGNNFLAQQTASFQGAAFSTLSPGTYNVGFACTLPVVIGINDNGTPGDLTDDFPNTGSFLTTKSFYNFQITVAASPGSGVNNFIWGQPAAPASSVLTVGSVTPTGGVVNFTKPAAIPAVSSYTANVTPSGGTAVVNATAGTITLSGLTTGTPYSVELTSTNGQLPNNPSGSVTVTPANAVPPAPVATAISKAGKATINWTAPASGPTPIGYTVTFATAPGALPAPIVLGNVLTTGDVTLPVGDFSASVKATYAVSDFITAPLASNVVTFKSLPNALIEQEITVQRQQLNALILTQRCGVNSELPSEGPTARFPGVSVIPAVTGNGNPPTKTDPVTGLQVPVTNFTEYPIPVSPDYPTRCALNLSTPQLITSGALRGQYFTATGAINQVTVADFRDADNGWTLTGTMGNFTDGGSNSFPGNYLGWNPATPIVSPVTAEGYAQTVTSGANVQPGDGVGGTFGTTGGLGGGGVLATGASGVDATPLTGGTGIADLNARVKLLIPTTANAATYKGILTFTVA